MYLRMNLTEQQEIIATFSEMAPRYESLMNNELNKFWGINYRDFVCKLLENISTQEEESILDIATGTAYIPSFLIEKGLVFKRIIGLDLTFEMLLNGKKRLVNSSYENKVPSCLRFRPSNAIHAWIL